ncbi:MAG: hypothetical protein E3J71_07875 [Candidatus Stahlbacteria bacterium]|nr:MAG: hypothetical protein E3J71_07875 [Candidatus Stahlbacteria bacterium]
MQEDRRQARYPGTEEEGDNREVRALVLLSSPEVTKDRRACGLHHDKGVLTLPECKKPSESEGAFFLYKGTFGFARNISAHHTKRLSGQATALQIVVFIDFLLRLLDTAQHS